MTEEPTPRRASDKPPSTQFQCKPRRAAVDQLDHHQELLVALEALAISLTIDREPGYAKQVRELARRYT